MQCTRPLPVSVPALPKKGNAMSLCPEVLRVNSDQYGGEARVLRCKRWSCEICHNYNRMKVMHAARRGQPNLFMTLTCNPANFSSPDEAARDMKRGLSALRRRIARRWKVKNIPFIVVYEKTKKGWPHMHLLMRAPFMHWKVLRAMWQEISGAHQVDVRFIRKATQVLFYVTKYIGKELHAFEGCKRWWRSHNYEELKDEPWADPGLGGEWRKEFTTLDRWVDQLITAGAIIVKRERLKVFWLRPPKRTSATVKGQQP